MPRIDSRQYPWIAGTVLVGTVATVAYCTYSAHEIDGPRGSTAAGLTFGIAAAAIMTFDAALNLRKRLPTWAIGRAETWLKGHIWLGLLTVPLVLFHGGFRFGGPLTTWLMYVFFGMIGSGIYGLVLQHWMPKFMTNRIGHETVYEQIPHVIERLRIEAYDIAAAVCGADVLHKSEWERDQSETIRVDYQKTRRRGTLRRPAPQVVACSEAVGHLYHEVRRYLMCDGRKGLLATVEGTERTLEGVQRGLPEDATSLHEAVSDLIALASQRRDLVTQERLHLWLHTWLLVHVPLTVALFLLLGAHVWWALQYSTVSFVSR